MSQGQEFSAIARAIIDANLYMVLGTADQSGQPWATPVYYASADYQEFFWVSSPNARHSQNLAARPELSIVIFNSQAPIGTGQGVYMSAVARALAGVELERGIDIFSRSSLGHGGHAWTAQDVREPRALRLYRATASAHWILDPDASPVRRIPVTV